MKEEKVSFTGAIEGFDIELQSLPSVAKHFASFDITKLPGGSPIVTLVEKSQRYLRLLFDEALKMHENRL